MDMVYIYKTISKVCHNLVILLYYKSSISKFMFLILVMRTFFLNLKIRRLNFQGIFYIILNNRTIAIGIKIM